jgi:hypothetical protein
MTLRLILYQILKIFSVKNSNTTYRTNKDLVYTTATCEKVT